MADWVGKFTDCEAITFDGMEGEFKAHVPRHFEKGEFDYREACNAGVCDLDWGLDAEECAATAKCDRNSCWGCSRDWSDPDAHNAPHEVCYHPTLAEEECNAGFFEYTDIDGETQTVVGDVSARHRYLLHTHNLLVLS